MENENPTLSPERQAFKDEIMEYARVLCRQGGCPYQYGGDHSGTCMLYVPEEE